MIIDIFTILVQIINFLILVFLLKKFLFSRILDIIDERENQIGKQFAEVEQKEKAVEQEFEKQREIREKLEREWQDNLARIKREIETKRGAMMAEAREAVNKVQSEWERAISTQREAFLKGLKRLSCQQVFIISKKVLSELANANLEDQLIESFINQLEGLDKQKREEFRLDGRKGLSGKNKNSVEINTAFPLSEESKNLLLKKVRQLINNDIIPSFHISDNLICGIELRTESKKIAWSMENYLDMLEEGLKDIFVENNEISNLEGHKE